MENIPQDDRQAATRDAALRDLDKLIRETRSLLNLVKELEVAVQDCRAQYAAAPDAAIAPTARVGCAARTLNRPTTGCLPSID